MLNNFIYSKTKNLFTKELEAGNVLDEAIVFIEDTREIWNHGTYFAESQVIVIDGLIREDNTITQEEYDTVLDACNKNKIFVCMGIVFNAINVEKSIHLTGSSPNADVYIIISENLTTSIVFNTKPVLKVDGDGTQFLSDDGIYKNIEVPTKVSQLENDKNYIENGDGYESGVYIAVQSGKLINPDEYDSTTETAVGVAVIDFKANFIIGLNHTTNIPWGTFDQGLNEVDISGLTNYTNQAVAATDMYGVTNTDVITSIYSGTDCAAGFARSQSITYGSDSLTGYLGSAGEWLIVLNNREAIESAMVIAGGNCFQTTYVLYYWTSTEFNSSKAWYAVFSEGQSLDRDDKLYKDNENCVVPFYKIDNIPTVLSRINASISVATPSANGLMSSTDKRILDDYYSFYEGFNAVTSIFSIAISKRLVIATISNSSSLSVNSVPTAGKEIHVIIKNSGTSTISIALPNAGKYVCLTDTALSIDAGSYAEVNIISDGTLMYIRYV